MVESADSKTDAGSTPAGATPTAVSPAVEALLDSDGHAAALIDRRGSLLRTNQLWKADPPVVPDGLIEKAVSTGSRVGEGDIEVLPLGNGAHAVVRLRRKKERLADTFISDSIILDAAGEGIYGLDADGRTVFVNRAASELIGWEIEDLVGKRQHDILHHSREDGQAYPIGECPIYATLRDGRPRKVADEVFWRKDGTAFPVEYTTTPVIEDGDVAGAVVVFRDVTEVKRALDRRAQSEAHFRAIIHALPDTVARISRDGIIREVRMAEGFNPEVPRDMEDVNVDIRSIVGSDLAARIQSAIRAAFATGHLQTFEYDWDVAGEPRTREARIVVIADDEVLAVIRDITSERAAQRSLKESEHRFRAIFNSMFQFIGLMELDGTLIEANQTALAFGGVDASDVIGKKIWDTRWWSISEEVRERVRDAVERAAAGEFIRYEENVLGGDGKPSTIDFSIKPVQDERGNIVLLIPEGRDIEEIKQAKDRLAESEARLAGIVESSLDSVMAFQSIRDENGRIVDFEWIYANKRAAEKVSRSVDDLIGKRLLVEMPGNREEGLYDDYVRVVEEGITNVRDFYYNHEGVEAYFVNTTVKLGDGFMVTFPRCHSRTSARRGASILATASRSCSGAGWNGQLAMGSSDWRTRLV
jgi:PAS domain S-box-containing protein